MVHILGTIIGQPDNKKIRRIRICKTELYVYCDFLYADNFGASAKPNFQEDIARYVVSFLYRARQFNFYLFYLYAFILGR